MRIAKLDLLAYGPFRGHSLDFSKPGVQLVFGRNEAGKSTTLRAITGLLYGIERQTRDAYVHKPADLRIGGTIAGDDGEVIRLVRRKGNTNTLLDDRGQPLDDAVVLRQLRGVTEETFRHAFGLDHDTLRRGAEALLDGKGDLGESLFDASVGGGGEVQRLLAELEGEGDRLWRPRGTALPLNDALRAFTDAQKAIREKETLPAAHLTQQTQLDETIAVRSEKVHEKAQLVRRRAQIDAARKRSPLERRRSVLVTERAALAAIAEHGAAIDVLSRRVPEHERALEEKRRLAADLIRAEARVEETARRAGVAAASVGAAPRLDEPRRARLFKLVTDREKLVERIAKERVEVERQERALAKSSHDAPAPPEDDPQGAALVRALERARALGDLETRIAAERTKVERRRRDLEAKAAGLGGHSLALDALCEIAVPSPAEVEAIAKRADAADRAVMRLEGDLEKLLREVSEVDGHIAESEGGFAPPDAGELRRVRALRDERWTALRAAKTPIERVAAESAFESAVRDGDVVVDRMLAEADRVTALGRLKARREHLLATRTKLEADLATQRAARAAVDADLAARFAPSAVRVTTPAAMRTWLAGRAALVEARGELVDAENEISANVERVEDARRTLAQALRAKNVERLADLVAEASRRVAADENARRVALETSRSRKKIEEELDARRATLARDEAALAEIRGNLGELVALVGVEPDASAEEIRSAVESMRELFASIDERARVVAAATALDEEVASFAIVVRGIASGDVPDALEAARALVARREQLTRIERELADVDARLAELGTDAVPEDIVALAADADALAADADAVARELEDLDANVDVLEREIKSLDERVGGIKKGIELMRGDSNAADAAAAAQEALARVRTNVEKFVRAKLASVILKREIERYREENQGPLLGRASSLFARLTLDAFTGLRAGFDDKDRASLRLVRAGGAEVDVEALSEGTRDQLYLSLRLASLLRYAEIAAPMPLVLDDVLVHFDDERSAAALAVLAEVAKTVQVLFFTHHARLVDLARTAIPPNDLVIHELPTRAAELIRHPPPA